MSRKRKPWSHSEGERPYTVTVYEREPGGMLYARVWDLHKSRGDKKGGWIRKSLGHKDKDRANKDRAKAYALKEASKVREGASDLQQGKITMAGLRPIPPLQNA
jgi:hypothetical protein